MSKFRILFEIYFVIRYEIFFFLENDFCFKEIWLIVWDVPIKSKYLYEINILNVYNCW